ncbi:hypothetical protein F53441_3036 [Fusarium austroafricanum]|uniref:Uncharacterized protein n=1 Tax=Fusarium austroafricanum TaxID=2364996 RepID=A0A8H4P0C3_9HYPO|nr:hypothetical protein F53441_3036 [Fusarium austroafricanum]
MASVMAFPQQQQQQQNLPIQTISSGSGSVDANLITALATYVTSGPHARSTTEQEISDLAAETLSQPGGRAHLEALIACDCPDKQVWKNQADAEGVLEMTKTQITISLGVPTLELKFEAKGAGFFVPFPKSALNAGTLYYNDFNQLIPGSATFKLFVEGLNLTVNIYRNQVYIGHFFFPDVPCVLPPGGKALNGTIA